MYCIVGEELNDMLCCDVIHQLQRLRITITFFFVLLLIDRETVPRMSGKTYLVQMKLLDDRFSVKRKLKGIIHT